jgi:O-antigen biosynthesis protein
MTLEGAGLPLSPALTDAYPQWIASRSTAAFTHADWVAERVRQWPFVPKLAIGMVVPAEAEPRVALTVRSLTRQMVGDWEMHVVAQRNMPAHFSDDPGLRWHQTEEGMIPRLNRELCGSNAHWVTLIDAGDQLASHALFSVSDAVFRHPEWSAVYSDEDRSDLHDVRSGPHFKPDLNFDLLRSLPYIGSLLVVRRELFERIEGFDPRRDGTEEYDKEPIRLSEALRRSRPGENDVSELRNYRRRQRQHRTGRLRLSADDRG